MHSRRPVRIPAYKPSTIEETTNFHPAINSRWVRHPRSATPGSQPPLGSTDYRTGYIHSHLRSPSGRVRWLSARTYRLIFSTLCNYRRTSTRPAKPYTLPPQAPSTWTRAVSCLVEAATGSTPTGPSSEHRIRLRDVRDKPLQDWIVDINR